MIQAKDAASSSQKKDSLKPRLIKLQRVILLCVLFGYSFFVVLRPVGDEYVLVGEAYIDGMMDGEAMKGLKTGKCKQEEFRIR
jgi:hypothetical protein